MCNRQQEDYRLAEDLFKGLGAGLLAGFAVTWVLTQFQNAGSKLAVQHSGKKQA